VAAQETRSRHALIALSESDESAIAIKIQKPSVLTATFHSCWLEAFEKDHGSILVGSIDLDSGKVDTMGSPFGHLFKFRYSTG